MAEQEQERPLILLCNDDGVFAPGIRNLYDVASEFGDVIIVAPDRQQSAVGHAITIQTPLRVNEIKVTQEITAYAVNGTPADCVKLAHDKILTRKPDLILSGINHGSNAGINIIYSGTVSAATEGTILGYPSIAASCTSFEEDADMGGVQEALRKIIPYVLEKGLPEFVTLNLNAPPGPLKGIKWTRQAHSRYIEEYDDRLDPFNRPYYWMAGTLEVYDEAEDVDVNAIKKGFASITPIHYDLTAFKTLEKMTKELNF
jgi:5'-nucleotidase